MSVLFCPFCRESFEGEAECPEHELDLVPFADLPIDRTRFLPLDPMLPLARYDLRFGRGLVLASAVLFGVAFFLPLVAVVGESSRTVMSGLQLATGTAPSTWVILTAAVALFALLFTRRSPFRMQGLRLIVPMIGVFTGSLVAYTLFRMHKNAPRMSDAYGQTVELGYEFGLVPLVIAALLCVWGGLRLGVVPEGTLGARIEDPEDEQAAPESSEDAES